MVKLKKYKTPHFRSQRGYFYPGAKGKSKNRKIRKKPKGHNFLLARRAKAKTAKKEQWVRFRQKAKFAKKAKTANRACHGHDKSSIKYGLMGYATLEV